MADIYNEPEAKNELEKLKRQLELANKSVKNARYGLVWLDAPEAFENSTENQLPVLEEVKELSILDRKQNSHILIEGDNYHSLTCLNYTHREKVDLIYIDPHIIQAQMDLGIKTKECLKPSLTAPKFQKIIH